MDMDLPIQPVGIPGVGSPKGPDSIREICEEVEGMFVGMLLKESTRPVFGGGGEDDAKHMESLNEYAMEMVGRELGKSGALGIADMLYEHLSDDVERPVGDG